VRARLRALAAAALLGGSAGCAYFNGVYNAKDAAGDADKLARAGQDAQAAGSYALAAAKAETVLVRYPKSRWRADALYLAGRGAAFAGDCARGESRLAEYLAVTGRPREERELATIALASCYVRGSRYSAARALLEPIRTAKERDVARQASLWAARAAVGMGEMDDALAYLGPLEVGAVQWELAGASIAARQYARAESLLTIRAARGDYREDVLAALRELWVAGEHGRAEALVSRYAAARTPPNARIALHLTLAELQMSANRDSLARAHLLEVSRLATEPTIDREAAARLGLLQLRRLTTLADVQASVRRTATLAAGSPLLQRMQDNLLLVGMLAATENPTGASLFLAAEVARDSLRAPLLAHTLFRQLDATHPGAHLTPKALLAAAALVPDSAAAYRERILTAHASSPFGLLVAGVDPGNAAVYRQTDELLRLAWQAAVVQYADTLKKLRPPPGTTAQSVTP
jgi:hypothetical protein